MRTGHGSWAASGCSDVERDLLGPQRSQRPASDLRILAMTMKSATEARREVAHRLVRRRCRSARCGGIHHRQPARHRHRLFWSCVTRRSEAELLRRRTPATKRCLEQACGRARGKRLVARRILGRLTKSAGGARAGAGRTKAAPALRAPRSSSRTRESESACAKREPSRPWHALAPQPGSDIGRNPCARREHRTETYVDGPQMRRHGGSCRGRRSGCGRVRRFQPPDSRRRALSCRQPDPP